MLRPDVLVPEPFGLFRGHVQDALALSAERDFDGGGDAFANRDAGLDLFPDRFDRTLLPQETVGQGLILAHQSEQQMFGLDVRAAVLAGFVSCEKYDATRFFCVAFEHVSSLLPLGPRSLEPQPREFAERHVQVRVSGRIAQRAPGCGSR